MTIWRYTLPGPGEFDVEMPNDARIIHFDTQLVANVERLTAWVETTPLNTVRPYRLQIVATGQTYDPFLWECVGTALLCGGAEVYHLLRKRNQ